MNKSKNIFYQLGKILLLFVITYVIGGLLRVGGEILQGHQGAPAFVTPTFIIYGIVSDIFIIIAFLLLADFIPVKKRIYRGVIFMLIF